MSLTQALLIFLFASICGIGSASEEFQTHRPLVTATLIGIALGDIKTGVIIGAQVELIALGWMTIGVATPPDSTLSSIVAVILCVLGKQSIGVAIGTAIPLAVVGQMLFILQKGTIDVGIMHWAERGVDKGELWKVTAAHFITAIPSALRMAIPAMLVALFADANILNSILNYVPEAITKGLQVSSDFLVVVGYAMILRILNVKEMIAFFLMGFLVMTFSQMTLVGLTFMGISLALIYLQISNMIEKASNKTRTKREHFIENEENIIKVKVTKKDLMRVFWRSQFYQISWNYERLQNLCYCYCMMPILKKLYRSKEELQKAVKVHLEYFNCQPFISNVILGANIAVEESMQEKVDQSGIVQIKIALAGPLAGIGDPIIWGIIRPVIAAVCAGISLSGNVAGPILFFVMINIVRLIIRYNGLMIAYREGTSIINKLKGAVPKYRSALVVLTYTVIGGLVAKWTIIKVPFVLYTLTQGSSLTSYTVQEQLDNIMPNILPLMLTFLIYWLLQKKVSPLICMVGLMIFGVIGYSIGILGI
ncbi:mannose/fructose/sorbose PTS transporter subunit IID [Clostridium beijerinckii]|jgi:Phosphotransferase system, mannose/fructose/N-acetylgalactosamine-specific component IID|uniref:PTS system mannose/fructose/sorbose family transporter subunit IID n=2 Tax=Clostridium beijerinckii TaxID=1520 RepID=A0AAE2RTK9_CLOBE|nr:mannose/fructose/sorbose PTS transporter subunit IID [Clostridium beijerinckii]ABR35046.1 PTS system mannose/fructose/sorbose family IID component [Clostridium beijerinckii NCIMB 8052]AIU03142.1 PTS system mannose/fructose/sorbose family IID component [Clostridium beijerinckii ATCC 35702]MBF7810319.1 PTS system mannose/fructose/sorbose family transporter subunit IID [Clostridium beijerinckii]NRT23574.1 mannose/fructose/sorbose-specific phosphotransferase system IID component [Clostridium bei